MLDDYRMDKMKKNRKLALVCGLLGCLCYTDFIRTETLCQGGELCNFRFVRHETDAGDGWERSKSI